MPRIVVCGAGIVGASVAWHLARRGAAPVLVERARPGAAASGSASGLVAADWNAGTPLDPMSRAGFALHRELARELGAERIGHRPVDALLVAAADDEDLDRHRRLPTPAWLDPAVAAHEVIGGPETTAQVDPLALTRALVDDAVAHGARLVTGEVDGLALDGADGGLRAVSVGGAPLAADAAVLALGPWTPRAQRWLALPQVLDTRMASVLLRAEAPAQAVWSEFVAADGRRVDFRIYPRPGGVVYCTGIREHVALPDDPDAVTPGDASVRELRRIAGVHAPVLRDAPEVRRSACHRALTVDGLPLIGRVPGAPGVVLATAHASWGVLTGPPTGRMVAEMLLDGASTSLDARPFALERLPAGRM